MSRGPNEEWDFVLTNLELVLTGDRSAVVGDDHEDRILEPRLVGGGLEEGADSVVRISYPALTVDELGVDFTGWPGVGTMVGSRHHEVMERLTRRVRLIGFLQGPSERVFVTHPPSVGESRLLAGLQLTR